MEIGANDNSADFATKLLIVYMIIPTGKEPQMLIS